MYKKNTSILHYCFDQNDFDNENKRLKGKRFIKKIPYDLTNSTDHFQIKHSVVSAAIHRCICVRVLIYMF